MSRNSGVRGLGAPLQSLCKTPNMWRILKRGTGLGFRRFGVRVQYLLRAQHLSLEVSDEISRVRPPVRVLMACRMEVRLT